MALQLIVAQAMAANPSLHDHCHGHSHEPDHTCLVTLIQCGGYDCSLPDIVPVTISTATPDVPVSLPLSGEIVPSHLLTSVIADAPPRGP
ncbi:hypothetical protein GCM10023212_06820 [Luteolibacter yonseiensis]